MTEDLKTPEQLAEDYGASPQEKDAFLAGYEAAKDEINSSNNSNGWISVKERLPDNGDCVLVYRNNIAEISIALALFDYWQIWGVTHWMPLPEPPKEEK